MRTVILWGIVLMLAAGTATASSPAVTEQADSSNAFYAGEKFNYVIKAPAHFRMVTSEARDDGYSFAFVPDSVGYKKANIVIGVNIYKVRGLSFESVLANDTASMRDHYGPHLVLRPIDSVRNGSNQPMTAFYLDDKSRFIPNVMTAYFYGNTEILIFELSISPDVVRVKAEDTFMNCLRGFSAMARAQLGAK
ncbi:MAG: hypothetical protein HY851_06335 [candidate division Zixibacteria bacterium]|nr:hypothetical protein [candidate division Zixibacteria bacterium]